MKFTKMHGCGNDYVYVNLFEEKIADPAKVSIAVSDRHFGIGSDGLITIGPSDIADFRMRIYNADGSEAEMCGNGIRCVAKYVYDHKMTDRKEITIETGAGVKTLQLTVADGKVSLVRVDMGEPILKPDLIPVDASGEQVVDEPIEVEGREWKMTCVSMGNPHAVILWRTPNILNWKNTVRSLNIIHGFQNGPTQSSYTLFLRRKHPCGCGNADLRRRLPVVPEPVPRLWHVS